MKVKKKSYLLYIITSKFRIFNLYKVYVSTIFIKYYNECYKIGLKTKDTLNLIKKMNNPILSLIASNLHLNLLDGKTLVEVVNTDLLDSKLLKFIKIAGYSDNLSSILSDYLNFTELRFKLLAKKASRTILVFTYSFICIVIIFVYLILFVPLTIMGTI